METVSRFIKLMEREKPFLDENGNLKQGSEFKIFENKYGQEAISCILNWKDGFLHSEDDIPAVQFDDSHTEHWENGKLSNKQMDVFGNLYPAIISDYGKIEEFWIDGERVIME
jgi:hypothetical protein